MKGLVTYFIRYAISGNVLLVLILIFGFLGLQSLQSTFFPEVPSRSIRIAVVYPGASPEEIEESVVLKIEDKLKGMTGVERVRSASIENSASVTVEIQQHANADDVLQDVENAVNQINSFPTGLESKDVYKVEQVNDGISFAITGSDDIKVLKDAARKVERDLLNWKGISKVRLTGFPDEEIVINFREEQLRTYNLTFGEVMNKIQGSNIDITGGTIRGADEELKIRARNKGYYASDIENRFIKTTPDGRVVRLRDVANVRDQWAESPARNFYNGQPAATVDVRYTNDEDLLTIVAHVREYVEKFNASEPVLAAHVTDDRSVVVEQRIDLLIKNGVVGFILVFVLLAMFLHYRIAFWVALSIPISFAGMFILATFIGVTINVISLFGMITVIGILVDDGVVISENIYRHYENGKTRIQAAIDGTLEVLPAVVAAVTTTIVVFCTFFLIEGRLGDFFGEMAVIVIGTLLFSLVEGALILPAHVAHSKALDPDAKPNAFQRTMDRFMRFLRDGLYRPSLEFSLRHGFMMVAIAIGMLIITFGAMGGGIIKGTFFPFIEGDRIVLELKMPSGTPDEVTTETLAQFEEAAWQANAVIKAQRPDSLDVIRSIDRRVGPVNAFDGKLIIKLLDNETRNMKVLDIQDSIRTYASHITGYEQRNFGTGGPFGKPISVALIGEDMDEVRDVAEGLKTELRKLSDVKDVTDNDQEGLREVNLVLRDKAYLLGLTERDVLAQVRQGFYGGEIQRVQRGLDEVRIWVRYDLPERAALSDLRDMYIRTADGGAYPLHELATWTISRGVIGINHMDGRREIRVQADVANADVSVSELDRLMQDSLVPAMLASHPDVSFSMEGQSREQQKSTGSMGKVMPIILLIMLAIIVLTFRSFLQMLAVFMLIPFGFIGVAWGHWIHGLPVSLFSILGMIALIGILINDSLVFVSAFNTNLKEGQKFDDALVEAAVSRFRPILLTSVTTIAGLAPLVLETSLQAQFLIPMALAIAYGLAVSTVIILVLLPIFLKTINSAKRFVHWYWYDERIEKEVVEPAVKEIQYEQAH